MAGEQYVFISYARQDGEAAAKQLVEELGKDSRVRPWRDRLQMRPGDFEEQIRQAIESSRYIVLVLTPAAIRSDWVKKEWRLAQKRGVCVLPVKSAPETELSRLRDQLPRWISQAHEYDLEREWELFVNQLNSPCRATRAPYMAGDLPFNFVKREDQFRQIVGKRGLRSPGHCHRSTDIAPSISGSTGRD